MEDIRHLSDKDQAEQIAAQFAKIQNEYEPLSKDDIQVPHFEESDRPVFSPSQVWFALTKLNVNILRHF